MVMNGETTTQELCLKSADVAFAGMDTENVVCSSGAIQAFDDVFMDGRMAELNAKVYKSCVLWHVC